jgi:hypothetical protein
MTKATIPHSNSRKVLAVFYTPITGKGTSDPDEWIPEWVAPVIITRNRSTDG